VTKCGENEEPTTECIPPCYPTCENPNPPFCIFHRCETGCRCKDGHIRDKFRGKCVPESSCVPEGVTVGHRNVSCSENQIATTCQSPCLPTCDMPEPPSCILIWCSHGCLCKDGYILATEKGPCVPKSSCKIKVD
ncbi:zonadhesin-like, partial [Asbolus verrucosus]